MNIAIICSKADPASMNIKDRIVEMLGDFNYVKKGGIRIGMESGEEVGLYKFDRLYIVEIERRLIYSDYIDTVIKDEFGVKLDEILFASRHSSKDGRKLVSCHVSGNVGTADYGGKKYSLAKPSPQTMKNYSMILADKLKKEGLDYMFSLEVTHHGPSEINTPSAFYEIGSTEREWRDVEIAAIVAESMLEAIEGRRDWNVAVGVGGTHYAPRQTEIELSTTIAFAHNFAKYTFEHLNVEFLKKAIEVSEAEMVVIDEKSTTSKVKGMVKEACGEVGINMYKSKTVKKEFSL